MERVGSDALFANWIRTCDQGLAWAVYGVAGCGRDRMGSDAFSGSTRVTRESRGKSSGLQRVCAIGRVGHVTQTQRERFRGKAMFTDEFYREVAGGYDKSFMRQVQLLWRREFKMRLRSKEAMTIRAIQSTVFGVWYALTYWQTEAARGATLAAV